MDTGTDVKKPVSFSEEELEAAGLRGEGALPAVTQSPSALSNSLSFPSSGPSESTKLVPAAHAPSDWESAMYYNGISLHPPKLIYRSNVVEVRFPEHEEGRYPFVPSKTVYGLSGTALNPVWHLVGPQICEILEGAGIQYSAVHAVRFLTSAADDEVATLGPIVIWIATYPQTTTIENAHDASPKIISLLEHNGVKGAVVEWIEGAIEKLSGPPGLPLLAATLPTQSTYHVRRFLTATLGMPISAGKTDTDAEGSTAFFFHENKTKDGEPSDKVFGVTSCHVLRSESDTTVDYTLGPSGAPRHSVRIAGLRRFQRGLDDISNEISLRRNETEDHARDIARLESANPEPKVEEELETVRKDMEKAQTDVDELEVFYTEITSGWIDASRRIIGRVDWAPAISVGTGDCPYTKDIGTFELDASKFESAFQGNVVDLGLTFNRREFNNLFHPHHSSPKVFTFPSDGQFRINGHVPRETLCNPDTVDGNNEPCLIVMKDGSTTGLTVGHCGGLEVYTRSLDGIKSMEVVIYHRSFKAPKFSDKGDSGSLVFDGKGRMVGIIHSALWNGMHSHVTYATPAWWIIEQIKVQYPHADFDRTSF